MSDHDDDDVTTDESPESIGGLRKAARAGQKALDENATLKRQLLFAKAGINTEDDGVGEMLYRTWDGGEDLEALKVKALKVGALNAAPSAPVRDTPADEDALRRQAQDDFQPGLGQPGSGADADGPDPTDTALTKFHENRRAGMPQNDAQQEAISAVIAAGFRGDKRVFFDQEAHNAAAEEARRARGY